MDVSRRFSTQVSATQRVFATTELREHIFSFSQPRDHLKLERVCRAFYHGINRPQMWQARFSPSQIDFDKRVVYTAFDPLYDGDHQCVGQQHQHLANFSLGLYCGQKWRLRPAQQPLPILNEHTLQLLDLADLYMAQPVALQRLRPQGFVVPNYQQPLGRLRAYNFLGDRFVRMQLHVRQHKQEQLHVTISSLSVAACLLTILSLPSVVAVQVGSMMHRAQFSDQPHPWDCSCLGQLAALPTAMLCSFVAISALKASREDSKREKQLNEIAQVLFVKNG